MFEINTVNEKVFEEIKKRLVDVYHPTLIYIFGSHAWGTPDAVSDIDIAVIVEESNESAYLRPQKGTLSLWDIKYPIDLLVFTSSEFYSKANHPSTLQNKILKQGYKLYEAA
ncbi:MAG: nucleotidyltransferase domain-containing protein [Victivallaceae bacterium]